MNSTPKHRAWLEWLRVAAISLFGGAVLLLVLLFGSMQILFGHGPLRSVEAEVKETLRLCGREAVDIRIPPGDVTALHLKFRFMSDNRNNASFDYGETSPPMPLLALPFALYQVERGSYRLIVSGASGKQYASWTGSGMQYVEAVYEDNTLTVRANNDIVLVANGPLATNGHLLVGKGYRQRYWCGWVKSFNLKRVGADGDARRWRLVGGRIRKVGL
jgi:hypothetical protein